MTCDFCNAPSPSRMYQCESFAVPVVLAEFTFNSIAEWWACEECAKLIDADEREKLLDRTIECHEQAAGRVDAAVRPQLLAVIRHAHTLFFEKRRTEAIS